mgnify:CR=1 FL=1
MRTKITLACTECKQRNYNMTKDKKISSGTYGDQEVLQILQETYVTQGNKVILFSKGREIMEENTVNTAVETTEKAARADKKTAKHEKKPSFFKGLKKEYKKIVFADKETVAKQTVAVVIMSIFIGALIGVLDMVMNSV